MAFLQLRRAGRSLLRIPALTTISILTVALGVGAGTSLFSVVKAVLLNPLPYPDAERLVWMDEVNDAGGPMAVSMDNFQDWAQQNHSFATMAAFGSGPLNAGGDVPERTAGAAVTPDFFKTIGVQPALGRGFLPTEHVPSGPIAVVIGHAFWQRAYGGDPKAIGRSIRMSGGVGTIVGIMPAGFSFPDGSELWLSAMAMGDFGTRTAHNFRVVGRLKPGVTLEQARADLSGIARALKRQYPEPYMGKDAMLTSLRTHAAGNVRPALLILFAAVGMLLLIVCVNVANLLLVRVVTRSRELAVRLALGAGRGHLARQMLAESMLLALAGGTLGFLLATWSTDLLKILMPADMPRASEIGIDWGVLAFAMAVTTACGLLFGLVPSWRATHVDMNGAIHSGSRSYTAGRGARRLQSALVVSEVCLSLALLAGAGVLANSFVRVRSVEPGFRSDHILSSGLYFSYPTDEAGRQRLRANYRELLTRVRAIPGVEYAGTTSAPPLGGAADGMFEMERGKPPENTDADYVVISPGYLKALHIPIREGRDFTESDTATNDATSGGVAIVSADMARRFWPGRSPLGERIWFRSFEPPLAPGQAKHWLTIVGVAADVREEGLTKPVFPLAYVLYTQAEKLADTNLMIRTPLDPAALAPAVHAALHSIDPEATVAFTTMEHMLAESMAHQRFQMQVLGSFAALALALAAVGLYGVLSYIVTGSRVEIGIRMALGARPGAVFRMVAARALKLAAAGAALGLAGFLALRGVLAKLLFGVGPGDPATLAGATAVLLVVALSAAYFPARRAMRVDPMAALRDS